MRGAGGAVAAAAESLDLLALFAKGAAAIDPSALEDCCLLFIDADLQLLLELEEGDREGASNAAAQQSKHRSEHRVHEPE